MGARKLPGEARSEIAKSERFQISDKGRDYRQVNRDNKNNDGLNRLRPEDYGRGSRRKK